MLDRNYVQMQPRETIHTLNIIDIELKTETPFIKSNIPVFGNTMSFSPDGTRVAFPIYEHTFNKDNHERLTLYDLEQRKTCAIVYMKEHAKTDAVAKWAISDVMFNHQGTELAAIANNNYDNKQLMLLIFDGNTMHIKNTFLIDTASSDPIKSMTYSADGLFLLLHIKDKIFLCNPHRPQKTPTIIPITSEDIASLQRSLFHGPLVITVKNYLSMKEESFLYKPTNDESSLVQTLITPHKDITGFALSPDGSYLALGHKDGISLSRRLVTPTVASEMTLTQFLFLIILHAYNEPGKPNAALRANMLFKRHHIPTATFLSILDSFDEQTKTSIMHHFHLKRPSTFQKILKHMFG